MNCPNCNKEVSPEWEFCPFCRYEPRKCSNPNCHSRWLTPEARFCPKCGVPLEGNNVPPSPPTVPKKHLLSVGDILCIENITLPVSEWLVAGKTTLGVVFYVDNGNQHAWEAHKDPEKFDQIIAVLKDERLNEDDFNIDIEDDDFDIDFEDERI